MVTLFGHGHVGESSSALSVLGLTPAGEIKRPGNFGFGGANLSLVG